tara:strand:- start:4577 stop:5188 length:612 start_codon:yes stop_codon:yes gene_type:complete
MHRISLLGCGYLGFPLALKLLGSGHHVKGSTTSLLKFKQLKKSGILPYLIHLENMDSLDFFESDILVLTLPFKKTFIDPNIYKEQIQIVCDQVMMSSIKHIVFTSSSSVYPKDKKLYLSSDNFIPTNARGKVLLECEKILNGLQDISVVTIRLGGIYGNGRSIKKDIKPRKLVSHKDALKLIENGINEIGSSSCINGFTNLIM